MKKNPIHIGTSIRIQLERRKYTVKWLAQQLGIQRPNCYRLLNASSIQIDTLFRVSQILQYDFFAEYSVQLKVT